MTYGEVDFVTYYVAARSAKASRGLLGHSMTIPAKDEASAFFLSEDGLSGYALSGNTILGVFSDASVGDRLGPLLADAKDRLWSQHEAILLDCFSPLARVYARHGFTETFRVTWNDEYAPKGWPYADLGRPDVVFMAAPTGADMAIAAQ